jgi:hypothetical protein
VELCELFTTYFGQTNNLSVVDIATLITSGPVLVRESPAPILVPIPRYPRRGWGRHNLNSVVMRNGREVVCDRGCCGLRRTFSEHPLNLARSAQSAAFPARCTIRKNQDVVAGVPRDYSSCNHCPAVADWSGSALCSVWSLVTQAQNKADEKL